MTVTIIPSDHTKIIVEAHIPNRTPAEVFAHWADADKLAAWWVPDVRQNDMQTGGAYEYHWPEGGWTLYGTFPIVEPGRRLQATWRWKQAPPEAPDRTFTVDFLADGDGTRVRVEHGPYDDSDEQAHARQLHTDGWLHYLGQLVETCAKPKTNPKQTTG